MIMRAAHVLAQSIHDLREKLKFGCCRETVGFSLPVLLNSVVHSLSQTRNLVVSEAVEDFLVVLAFLGTVCLFGLQDGFNLSVDTNLAS